ncbi:hypothetical protein E3T48_12765 [Cryobacterium fucosi]|uniref:Uncharacterized protein n=1 Tax=Cryobacterium fucosi TaxID=1259157 RepID=A0A4V3IUZ1_9MICO|nr:hypothetical protein E3T48_12765 [Cryobacterium fucosi]
MVERTVVELTVVELTVVELTVVEPVETTSRDLVSTGSTTGCSTTGCAPCGGFPPRRSGCQPDAADSTRRECWIQALWLEEDHEHDRNNNTHDERRPEG